MVIAFLARINNNLVIMLLVNPVPIEYAHVYDHESMKSKARKYMHSKLQYKVRHFSLFYYCTASTVFITNY